MWTAENSRTAQRQARLERLAHAFDISGDAALLIDRETLCVVDANEAACRQFGCKLDELLMLQPNEITGSGNTAAELAAILDDVIAHVPRTTTTETISRKKDGTSFASEVRWVAMCSAGRWIVVVTIQDVTEHKKSQARLVQFRAALDQSPDALALVDRESMRNAGLQRHGGTSRRCHTRGIPRDRHLGPVAE